MDKSRSSDGSEGKASDIEEETEKKTPDPAEVNWSHPLVRFLIVIVIYFIYLFILEKGCTLYFIF